MARLRAWQVDLKNQLPEIITLSEEQQTAWAEIKEETFRLLLKMQTSTVSPVTNTTLPQNTTAVTKSQEQILIQSSGAMIAVIVIGIILILAILLIILKTYNRFTHTSRILGSNSGSKQRGKMSQSTGQSNVPLNTMGINSVAEGITNLSPIAENGFQLPRAELSSVEGNHLEQFSTTSSSTVVTIHDTAPLENT
ncbi:noncompact myelin-associated protein [Solea senegalensis]|uniref:Noncompact myelin-associated protein n=2 Tax=Solea senegalensis TaxID=28829 RepID=A0AAV6S2C9_SOLSE|nr:noncompact myelin-associated protein [Solea senegalensis]